MFVLKVACPQSRVLNVAVLNVACPQSPIGGEGPFLVPISELHCASLTQK